MPDGTARQFTFDMEAKSLITRPSGGDTLPGAGAFYELTGIAWTRPRHDRSASRSPTDGGATWTQADLQTPVLPHRAHALPLLVEVGRQGDASSRRAARTTPATRSRRSPEL